MTAWFFSLGNSLRRSGRDALSAVTCLCLCHAGLSLADVARPSLPAPTERALGVIRGAGIVAHAKVLSASPLRGREASTHGARKAARYISDEFRKLGLRPGGSAGSYYQVFKIQPGYRIRSSLNLTLGGDPVGSFERGADYMPVHLPNDKAEIAGPCVLVGYGITSREMSFDEYAGLDLNGKIAIVFSGVPWPAGASNWITNIKGRNHDTLLYKARNAAEHGAVAMFIVDNPAGWRKQLNVPEQLRLPDTRAPLDVTIPVVHVDRGFLADATGMSVAELRLLALDISRDRRPHSMLLRARKVALEASISGNARIGRNVVGVLPCADPAHNKEAVVIGAHYDHLGEGFGEDIYFGANDNAAGVGVLLEIARAFASLPLRPRRTVIFVAFDAEEIGRRGSKQYIHRPVVPIRNTVLMINFDMIGRNEPNHIYAVGTRSSDELHRIHLEMNRHTELQLAHPESLRLGRSDHSPFYQVGVPVMYMFGGRDVDYNTPQDTWDKLIPGKVEKVARLSFLTALEVTQREEAIQFKRADLRGPLDPFAPR